jgi:sterol desaturase/sphingolipid hydroxylase (fatty acid hydroxylase superfamily)
MESAVMLAVLLSLVLFVVLDFVRPARTFVKVRWWRLKGVAFFVLSMGISTVLPFLWADWVERHRLLNLTALGTLGGAAVGYVVSQLFAYWWHRLMHSSDFLWRWCHQMHHSAERVDIFGATYFHPFDIGMFTVVQALALNLVLGLSPSAAAVAGFIGLFYALFQHANIRTPRWLGVLIQRPESHGVHHQRGVHGFNYGDFPLWDMLFGTFRNPAAWQAEAGFYDGASRRVGAMLIGRNLAPGQGQTAATETREVAA